MIPLPTSLHDQTRPRFKGVRMRRLGRWVSEIRIPQSRDKIWLGSYFMPELAARAYDTAYLLLRGPSASSSLNLSDSYHLITPHLAPYTNGRHAITRRTIQTAAAEIANAIAGVETPLQLHPAAAEEQGMAALQLDIAENGDESSRDRLRKNSTGEASLQDLVSMESRWIHDALNLLSPREKTSASFFYDSAAASNRLQGAGSLSCSTNLDEQQLMSVSSLAVCDEFQQALQEWLAQDGFIPMSAVVTTIERFDTDVAPPSDALWSYP